MRNESHEFLLKTLDSKDYHIQPLAGDASTRRYYRVVLDETSTVLMEWEPFGNSNDYPFLNVQRYFRNVGVQVPRIIAFSAELGLVLQEDLGDLTLERRFGETQDKQLSIPHYKQALDELIKIQFDATDLKGNCIAFHVEFDVEKFMWEMNYAKKHLLEQYAGLKLSEKVSAELNQIFIDICSKLHDLPKRICHRDYHSRNVMIKFNCARVIDFQDARMGPIQYDLVSLLRDSYVDIPEDITETLLEYYCERVNGAGQKLKLDDEFFHFYEIQTIQRCFKACGSFSSFFNMREDERYIQYLPKTSQQVVNSLAAFDEYKTLSELVQECELIEQ